jgi:hypothetical protein
MRPRIWLGRLVCGFKIDPMTALCGSTAMPKGPNGENRPADAIGLAVHIGRIATGEVDDAPEDDGKDPAAKAMGKKGGAARAASMTPERRSEIAKAAAAKRWKKS